MAVSLSYLNLAVSRYRPIKRDFMHKPIHKRREDKKCEKRNYSEKQVL